MKETEKLQVVQSLINIQSVNGSETPVADYLIRLLGNHGIKAQRIEEFPGRFGFVAEIGDGQHPKLGLSGHLDTVAPGKLDSWTSPPFEATIRNRRIFGRGAADMKGGLAAMVITMIELSEQQLPVHGTLRLMATVSEELTESGAHFLAEHGYGDDLDAFIFGEPTGVALNDIDAYFNSGGAKIDPQQLVDVQNRILDSQAPEQHFLVTAHKGWMTYTVSAQGKSAHSSMPKMGVNAIDALVSYYVAEQELYDNLHEIDSQLGATVYSPDIIQGGHQVNSVPDTAFEQVKVRTIPELPNDDLIMRLQQLIDELNLNSGVDLTLTVNQSEPPVINPGRTNIVTELQLAAAKNLSEPCTLPIIGVSLGTDASEFRRFNPTADMIILGPGNTSAHQADEYLEMSSYFDFIHLYEQAANAFLSDPNNHSS
ncbi:M20/M25/M40 family metallo-hydrolase [Secundilactobacillus folii]|uniref:M20/M25/M40 family metallo-hydrolase n=1 Tax=Secundilactobacillus folii TaxID=2678357 RepID=A0A7X2XVR7_9LACO|nr:M20/M25/M40 family metallo-hydrolase [Secundilactobacillus folii]MTV81793.1 M20/M25/M40 family metallo-hydrolase [Secundilactobacillus folii]